MSSPSSILSRKHFCDWSEHLRPASLRYLITRGIPAEEAQDCVQCAFLGAWRSILKFDANSGQSGFAIWMLQWLDYARQDALRRRASCREDPTDADLIELAGADLGDLADTARWYRDGLRQLIEEADLTERQGECLHLALDGWSAQEIGRYLGITRFTVYAHLEAAEHRLQKHEAFVSAEIRACWLEEVHRHAYRRCRPSGAGRWARQLAAMSEQDQRIEALVRAAGKRRRAEQREREVPGQRAHWCCPECARAERERAR